MFSKKSFVVVDALDFFKQATLASPQPARTTCTTQKFTSIALIEGITNEFKISMKLKLKTW